MGTLQAQQIVDLACQIAKCPGFIVQAGQMLNVILEELAQDYDFKAVQSVFNFNFTAGPGPFAMPSNWLRGIDESVFYTIDAVPYIMVNIQQQEYDRLAQPPGLQSFPTFYYVDVAGDPPANNMFVWPPASGAYPVTARYYTTNTIITSPESSTTIPWFPNTNYLITRLSGEMMKFSNDDRVAGFLGDDTYVGAAGTLKRFMQMKDDPEGTVNIVKLDRRRFGRSFSRLPNTKTMGW